MLMLNKMLRGVHSGEAFKFELVVVGRLLLFRDLLRRKQPVAVTIETPNRIPMTEMVTIRGP